MGSHFLFSYVLALVVVGLMLFGLYAVVRGVSRGRTLGSPEKRLVGVVSSTYVSQNTTIHVVKAGSKYLLVGGGSGQLRALGEIPAHEVEAWSASQRDAHQAQVRSIAGVVAALRGKRS
jgi:flagellar biogenesis protein FliO